MKHCLNVALYILIFLHCVNIHKFSIFSRNILLVGSLVVQTLLFYKATNILVENIRLLLTVTYLYRLAQINIFFGEFKFTELQLFPTFILTMTLTILCLCFLAITLYNLFRILYFKMKSSN